MRKKTKNISDYKGYKEIYRLNKYKSPYRLVFVTNDPEKWFINCIEYRIKNGEIKNDSLIIASDLEDWIKWHEGMGWKN